MYKTILLKLSGESLAGASGQGFDAVVLQQYAEDIKDVYDCGCNIAIVVGGGNIFRGISGAKTGFDRTRGDYMGMLATIINSMAIQDFLEKMNVPVKLMTSIEAGPNAELMSSQKMFQYFKEKKVLILGGGTGNPFFTTDSAAALRAAEIKADILLKGTRVDGIYDSDPEKNPNAKKYETISFDDVYAKKLKVMDLTAITMCKENNIPLLVFDMNKKGNLLRCLKDEKIGTKVII